MTDDAHVQLEQWQQSLAQALHVDDLPVDIDAVLGLAGVAAHAVVRPAAPLTTFLVGLAAGRAAANGEAGGAALRSAIATATELCRAVEAEP